MTEKSADELVTLMNDADRAAARDILAGMLPWNWERDRAQEDEALDRILALVRPAEGVVLTPDEARLAAYGLRHVGDGTAWRKPEHTSLAERLEASL